MAGKVGTTPVMHGQTKVDYTVFAPVGGKHVRYTVLSDVGGYKAGQEVSRRKAIELSHGGKKLEELISTKWNWRERIIARYYENKHGSLRGFEQVLDKLNAVFPITQSKKGVGWDENEHIASGWQDVLDAEGLDLEPPDEDDFYGSPSAGEEVFG